MILVASSQFFACLIDFKLRNALTTRTITNAFELSSDSPVIGNIAISTITATMKKSKIFQDTLYNNYNLLYFW